MPLPLILLNLFLLFSILTEIVKNEQLRRLKFYLNRKKTVQTKPPTNVMTHTLLRSKQPYFLHTRSVFLFTQSNFVKPSRRRTGNSAAIREATTSSIQNTDSTSLSHRPSEMEECIRENVAVEVKNIFLISDYLLLITNLVP